MRVVWASDIHLDHASDRAIEHFVAEIKRESPDLLVVTGDISVARKLDEHLEVLHYAAPAVNVVFGNHDYWGGSIIRMRRRYCDFNVGWLGREKLVELAPGACLVGVDGWYDMRAGNPVTSMGMNDWAYTAEFKYAGGVPIEQICRDLADDDTKILEERLRFAIMNGYTRILIATHVPPFERASFYRGKQSPPESIGCFANVGLGDMLEQAAAEFRDVSFEVLCGHTHDKLDLVEQNLRVLVAGAEYRYPRLATVWEVK